MDIIEARQDDVKIYRVRGRLDSNSSPELEKKIFEAIGNGSKDMVLDFEQLEYISSAGLRVILKATKDIKRADGKIVLCAMQDYVKEVFEISGFDSLLPIVTSVDDAVKTF